MRLRVIGDGLPDNWIVVDDRGDIVDGVVSVTLSMKRGEGVTGTIVLDGIGVDVLAEIRRMTE